MPVIHIQRRDKQFIIPSDEDTRAFWQDFASGGWEDGTLAALDRYLTRDSIYLDIGAWIGPTLLYASQIATRCIGIEPDPVAFAKLQQNVDANCQGRNVMVHHVCLAQRSGPVRLGSRGSMGDSMSSMLFAGNAGSWDVEGLSFRDLVSRVSLDHCDVIKMDIEGAEYAVIPSMRHWLTKHKPVFLLSLHPHLLSAVERLVGTARVLFALRSYRQLLDENGAQIRRLDVLRSSKWGIRQSIIAVP